MGEALIIIGGKVSFKPPVGVDFLAHWIKKTKVKKNKKYFPSLFMPISCAHKITQYSQDNLLASDSILSQPPLALKIEFIQQKLQALSLLIF